MRCKNRTLSEWLSIIMESRKSGFTDIEWCRRNDINYEAFKTAAKRLRGASITLPRRTKPKEIDFAKLYAQKFGEIKDEKNRHRRAAAYAQQEMKESGLENIPKDMNLGI